VTLFAIDNDIALLIETGIYQQIGATADKRAPLLDRRGKMMGPWNATKRRKISRATVDGVTITHSIRRDADSWTVREETRFQSADFTAEYEEVNQWDFDPTKPFPYTAYDDQRASGGSIWNELAGDWCGLMLDRGLGHFFNWIGVDRDDALAVILEVERADEIDEQDATIARLVLA